MLFSIIFSLLLIILIGITSTILYNQIKVKHDLIFLNERIEKLSSHSTAYNDYIQTKLLDERKAHLLVLMYEIRDVVSKQQFDLHAKLIENSPRNHNVSNSELTKMFSLEQIFIIQRFWTAYHTYLQSHWTSNDGKVKSVFRGNPGDTNSELHKLHQSSKLLVKQFDHWLTELNSSS
ncbi:hypothetical protein [Halalkalibacter alkaliphilus]|uniref:Uncharacterized protein n=1 Tax=Halalkalibacter alkaliphilus TaxID=2917993 RepID=A0A9X2CP63_9BACI|nr:hypothetical protein [Halalkalibacter alkaliphilus]MCL7745827.1 hypothetical protein [Halalkalibacter alkaliphilus]